MDFSLFGLLQVSCDIDLPRGNYLIVPSTFDPVCVSLNVSNSSSANLSLALIVSVYLAVSQSVSQCLSLAVSQSVLQCLWPWVPPVATAPSVCLILSLLLALGPRDFLLHHSLLGPALPAVWWSTDG